MQLYLDIILNMRSLTQLLTMHLEVIDINRGDTMLGWDTDQFPNNPADLINALLPYIFYMDGFR